MKKFLSPTKQRYRTWILAQILASLIFVESAFSNGRSVPVSSGYAPVNGLEMYYEIHGSAAGEKPPLVLLHGGGSTIDTSFGNILPFLAKERRIIAVEEQGHGHTADIIDRPFSFEQSADDVAALLAHLKIEKADLFGFSNGGNVALQVAIRHPQRVRKLIVASAMFRHAGLYPGVWEFMKHAQLENMPQPLKDAYRKVAPHPEQLRTFHDKCAKRMLEFKDWRPEDIQSIEAPTLVIVGDADSVRPEHAVEMFRLLPQSRLAVLPGGHGEYIGEATAAKVEDSKVRFGDSDSSSKVSKLPESVAAMIDEFLDAAVPPRKENANTKSPRKPDD